MRDVYGHMPIETDFLRVPFRTLDWGLFSTLALPPGRALTRASWYSLLAFGLYVVSRVRSKSWASA